VRIGLDITTGLTQSAGIGRYVRELVHALVPSLASGEELVLWHGRIARRAPFLRPARPAVCEIELPLSPVWVTRLWQRLRVPVPLEHFTGRISVSHGPDFVAPPSRAPCIVTVHDLSFVVVPQHAHPRLRQYLATTLPHSLRRASAVIAVSEQVRQELIDHYRLPPDRVITISHGVTTALVPAPAVDTEEVLTRLGVHQPYFLMVGTIEPRKNHLGALEAFARLAAHYPEASLVVTGAPGWLSQPILRALSEAASRHRVRFLGHVSDADLAVLYTCCVALIYPSWYEGFGLPVLEAMALGAPVVTSNRGALAEIAGDAALTAAPGRPEELAAAMEHLLCDSVLRRQLAESGMRRAKAFSWERAARMHLDLYRSVSGRSL
jgi:glycosyltransferase involved in cell wall biosynthesis